MFVLQLATGEKIPLRKPSIMGVINLSPNSFYSPVKNQREALQKAAQMVKDGVDIIDVGAVATNPFVNIDSTSLSAQQEMDQLLPVLQGIKQRWNVLVSIDTSITEVMRAAVFAGADMINDQKALSNDNAMATVSELKVPVCLMHFFYSRIPGSCSNAELLQTIKEDFHAIVNRCLAHGISRQQLIIDPGFGGGHYGKNSTENFYLLAHLSQFVAMGFPVLVGWSRKSMIGEALGGVPPQARLHGSIAAATIAALKGAAILRVHDVAETRDAIQIVNHLCEVD